MISGRRSELPHLGMYGVCSWKATIRIVAWRQRIDRFYVWVRDNLKIRSINKIRLRDAFSESDLPFKVDIVDWALTSTEFKEIIKRGYEVLK